LNNTAPAESAPESAAVTKGALGAAIVAGYGSDEESDADTQTSSAKQLPDSHISSTLPPGGASTLPPGGASTLPPGGVSTLPPEGASILPPGGASTLPPEGASTLPPGGASTLPPEGASTLPPEGASILPPGGASTLPPEGASTLPPEGASTLPLGGTKLTSAEKSAAVSHGILKSLVAYGDSFVDEDENEDTEDGEWSTRGGEVIPHEIVFPDTWHFILVDFFFKILLIHFA